MENIRLFSAAGIGVLVVTAGGAALVTWLKYSKTTGHDQPILISDGSMFIHRKDEGAFSSWKNDNPTTPSNLYPNEPWQGADVYEDTTRQDGCATSENKCSIDITYDHPTPSIHFVYDQSASNPMTITSDYDTFNTWTGYQDYLMYHPRMGRITAVTVNGSKKSYQGKVRVVIKWYVP